MDFNTWQEHKHNNSIKKDTTAQTQMTEEVMVSQAMSALSFLYDRIVQKFKEPHQIFGFVIKLGYKYCGIC